MPSTRYAQSDGAKIAFQVSGEGPCDLVFVPGLVSHLDLQWQQLSYRRFVTALGQACRVIRFDKRGTGLSDPTDALPSMDERVVDLAAVMDAAGSQAAVLLGVAPLTPELITEIICADLTRRGIQAPGQVPSPADKGWLDLVHSAYYVPVAD